MNVLTFSETRANLKSVMDNVCTDHAPTVVTRVGGNHVVIMSLSNYNSLEETLYLLSSTENAKRLDESIAQFRVGRATLRKLIKNGNEKDDKQREGQV